MIHATNAAVIGLPDAKPEAFDLPAKLALRGKRAAATGADLMPTGDDEIKMGQSFKGIVVLLLLSYCPGSNTWADGDGIRKLAEGLITKDRPLPPQKTDVRPLGVFDVNEGSKKGILKMLVELQKTSQLSQEEWSAAVRIIEGDWLTSNNLRGARKDRTDDINGMERVEYPEELSALWHFALNAMHMLMRLHLGHAIVDPGSLAKHKGLLNRNWDAEKPNYADAKALIRHSLIARILYSAMLQNGIDRWADLHKWEPTVEDVEAFANNFVEKFAMPSSAEKAKAMNDDYLAHSVYFIRDALIFCVFEHAVSHADAGPVLRVLKYWTFSFRGAGLHNYGRECAEVLLRWQYELTSASREALEQSWFVNRWGRPERWIAADLYLEQLNYWVKRVFIAKGSAVTVEYIIEKGSAPVEFWRELSHAFARAFGYPDRARRSKEVDVGQDLRLLTENLIHSRLHVPTADRPIYANTSSKQGKKQASDDDTRPSAIVDAIDVGGELWNNGKFTEFIRATTWDPAVGYPVGQVVVDAMGSESVEDADDVLMNGSVFDQTTVNPLAQDAFEDIDDGDDHTQRAPGMGGLGGGMDYTDTIT
ncbi:hypothetical protein OF83DRAFT_1170743 [Amylostereum chailletii]|nr:hypothetical protein OF83DRAFT_1170743 [Amylostereum chailletii]